MTGFDNIKELAQKYLNEVDIKSLEKAYRFAEKVHADQVHPACYEA